DDGAQGRAQDDASGWWPEACREGRACSGGRHDRRGDGLSRAAAVSLRRAPRGTVAPFVCAMTTAAAGRAARDRDEEDEMVEHLHEDAPQEEPHDFRRGVADRFERRIRMSVPERHNEKLRALVAAANEDDELYGLWLAANVNAIERLGMTDHGPVH